MNDALLTLRDVHVRFPAKRNWRGKVVEHVHALNGLDPRWRNVRRGR